MVLITAQDVLDRLSDQAYRRLFAKSGGAVVDTAFRDLCVAEANSRASLILQAAFPGGLDAPGGTVDVGVKGLVVDMACGIAAMRHPASDPAMGAYAKAKAEAERFLERMCSDQKARPVTSAAGRAQPRARVVNGTDDDGVPTNPLTRVADGRDGSSY